MTTKNIEDISQKRKVPTKYMPNSYRIFCEEISNDSIVGDQKYQSQAPPIFTQPMIVPAQAIEDRNHPHAGRQVSFLRENARTLNEPVAKVQTRNPATNKTTEIEKRWWEWNTVSSGGQDDPKRRVGGKRSQSNAPPSTDSVSEFTNGSSGGFQTTYQKDHGYLRDLVMSNGKMMAEQEAATRHGANPNGREAVGIVPVNELNSYSRPGEEQRVFVDKMSFDHQYDSRKDTNYPIQGKRQGAFVLDQVQPQHQQSQQRPQYGLKTRVDSGKGASIWDLMQPENKSKTSQPSQNERMAEAAAAAAAAEMDARNHRRDPIGYFSDTKYGDQYKNYKPSWTNGGEPIAVNGGLNQ